MAALVMLVLLVCACSLFCELFQRRLEEVVPLAACAIVLMMYAFALAGLLRAGALRRDARGALRWIESVHAPCPLRDVKPMTAADWYV